MQILQIMLQKTLSLIILVMAQALVLSACVTDPSHYGKVKKYSSTEKRSFVFSIDESFFASHKNSEKDDDYPLMTTDEVKLLKSLLMQDKYCLNEDRRPSFQINSRQEKIYDMTFAHLIEQSYNAKPVTPRMYFGECAR